MRTRYCKLIKSKIDPYKCSYEREHRTKVACTHPDAESGLCYIAGKFVNLASDREMKDTLNYERSKR